MHFDCRSDRGVSLWLYPLEVDVILAKSRQIFLHRNGNQPTAT